MMCRTTAAVIPAVSIQAFARTCIRQASQHSLIYGKGGMSRSLALTPKHGPVARRCTVHQHTQAHIRSYLPELAPRYTRTCTNTTSHTRAAQRKHIRLSSSSTTGSYELIPVRLSHTARLEEDSGGEETTYLERNASTDQDLSRSKFIKYKLQPGNNVIGSSIPVTDQTEQKTKIDASRLESEVGEFSGSGAAEYSDEFYINRAEEVRTTRGRQKFTMEVDLGQQVDGSTETYEDIKAITDLGPGWQPPELTEEELKIKEEATRVFQECKHDREPASSWYHKGRNGDVKKRIQEKTLAGFVEMLISKDIYRTTKRRKKGFDVYDDYNLLVALQEYDTEKDVNWQAVSEYVSALSRSGATIQRKLVSRRWFLTMNPDLKHGMWSTEDDQRLREAVEEVRGEDDKINWVQVHFRMGDRSLKQCRERWMGVLNPNILRGMFTREEDLLLADLVKQEEMRPAHLKQGKKFWSETGKRLEGRTYLQCKHRWVRTLDPRLNMGEWTAEETQRLRELHAKHDGSWVSIAADLEGRSPRACHAQWVCNASPAVDQGLKPWSTNDIMKLAMSCAKHKTLLRHTWGSVAKSAGLLRAHHICRHMWLTISTSLVQEHNYDAKLLDIDLKVDPSEIHMLSEYYQKGVNRYIKSLHLRKGVDEVVKEVDLEDKNQIKTEQQQQKEQIDYVKNTLEEFTRELRALKAKDARQITKAEEVVKIVTAFKADQVRKRERQEATAQAKRMGTTRSGGAAKSARQAAYNKKIKEERGRQEYQYRSLTESFEKAKAIDDEDQMFFYSYARALVNEKLENFDAAIEDYKLAASIRTDDARPHISMGLVYCELFKEEEALECFNEGFNRNPDEETQKLVTSVMLSWVEEAEQAEEVV